MATAAYLAQQVLNAVQVGLLYALIAVAHVLFHGPARRFNLALGGLAVWGAYLAVGMAGGALLRAGWPGPARFALACAAGAATGLVFGAALTRGLRPALTATSLAVLVATLGWGIALGEGARLATDSRELWLAPFLAGPLTVWSVDGGTLQVTRMQGLVWLSVAAALVGVLAVLRWTGSGRLWRAVSQDLAMARLVGVDADRVLIVTGCAAGALCGLAGALGGLAYGNATFHGGMLIGLKALFAAVLGGLGSPAGAVAAAMLLALFETLWSAYMPGDWRDVASFSVLALCLVLRPGGLAGNGDRSFRV